MSGRTSSAITDAGPGRGGYQMMKNIKRAAETVRKSAAVALSSLFILGSLAMPVYANAENSADASGSATAENTQDPGTAGSADGSGTENTVGSADTGTSADGADTASASGNGSTATTSGSGNSASPAGNTSTASSSGSDSTAAASGDSYGNGMTDPPLSSEEAAASTGEASGSEGTSLTPSGNMTLVDDLDGGNREFLTVTTKDGNYFYLIIDKNDDGTGNVYFLNKVDEEDLLSLMDDKTASKVREDLDKQAEEQEAAEASVTSSSASTVTGSTVTGDETKGTGRTDKAEATADAEGQTGAEKAVICGGCAAIAGVVIAAAVRKRKKKGESRDQDDTYDDEYEEEYDFPEEEEGPGDENDEDGSEDQEEK